MCTHAHTHNLSIHMGGPLKAKTLCCLESEADVTREEQRDATLLTLRTEEGAMSLWVGSEKRKRQHDRFSLGAFGEKHSPADSLILVREQCRISNLQK